MNPKITDVGVSGLPVAEGRAELLEEIMATARIESVPKNAAPEPPRRSRWLPAAGAAAAVAVVATGAVWVGSQYDEPEPRDAPVGTTSDPGELAVLGAAGWRLDDASQDEYGGELEYHLGCDLANPGCPDGQELTVKWTPTEPFDLYAEDTMEIDGEQVGERLDVLDRRALLFHYSAGDHLAVIEVLDDYLVEIRGEGMDEASFRDVLARLEPVAVDDIDARLPERFISDDERAAVIEEMLAPLPLPAGFDPAIESVEWQRDDLGANVVSPVVCAWVDQFREARRAGDSAAAAQAQDALATVRQWPVLQEMGAETGYPSVVREIADAVVAGRVPAEYRDGLGCE